MGDKAYALLTWTKRVGYEQPEHNLAMLRVLNDSKYVFSHEKPKNAMSREEADEFLKECHPRALISAEGTLEQIRQKVERTGHL